MRCPSCYNDNGYDDDSLCDECWGDIEQEHAEYEQYLNNLTPLQRAAREVKGVVTRTNNAIYRWKHGF